MTQLEQLQIRVGELLAEQTRLMEEAGERERFWQGRCEDARKKSDDALSANHARMLEIQQAGVLATNRQAVATLAAVFIGSGDDPLESVSAAKKILGVSSLEG